MTDLLKNPIFKDETKAREWLEARVWPKGPTCPHCGNADEAKITALQGKRIVLGCISAPSAVNSSQ